MADIINQLAGASPELVQLRARRPDALANAQLSFQALLEPKEPGTFSYAQRYAVAAFLSGIYQAKSAGEFYGDLLADEATETLQGAVQAAIEHGTTSGPYAAPADISGEGAGFITFGEIVGLDERLAAAFDFAHLLAFHPKDASAEAIGHLQAAGWSEDDIVSLSQLIAFLSFQLRVIHGLKVLGGDESTAPEPVLRALPTQAGSCTSTRLAQRPTLRRALLPTRWAGSRGLHRWPRRTSPKSRSMHSFARSASTPSTSACWPAMLRR